MEGKRGVIKLVKRVNDVKYALSKNKSNIDLMCLLYTEEIKLKITLNNIKYGK